MNKKNTRKLLKDFPEFFNVTDPRQSLMCFGFICDDGWFDLIYKLCSDIKKETSHLYPLEVLEVKEKFGGLRFYTGGGTKKMGDLIRKAENDSFDICERCGKPGTLMVHNGWYKTVCPKCAKKEGYVELPKR